MRKSALFPTANSYDSLSAQNGFKQVEMPYLSAFIKGYLHSIYTNEAISNSPNKLLACLSHYHRDGWYDTRTIDTTVTDTNTYSITTWFLASSIQYLIKPKNVDMLCFFLNNNLECLFYYQLFFGTVHWLQFSLGRGKEELVLFGIMIYSVSYWIISCWYCPPLHFEYSIWYKH